MLKTLQTKQLATPIQLLCTSIESLSKKTPADTAGRKHQVNNCPLFAKKLNKKNNLTADQ